MSPGDLFRNRYKIVAELGWGASSTVWLAQDTQGYGACSTWCVFPRHTFTDGGGSPTVMWLWRSPISDIVDEDAAKHELNINRRLKTNPSHEGFRYVRTVLDNFEATRPDGTHLCLVYEPMREPLSGYSSSAGRTAKSHRVSLRYTWDFSCRGSITFVPSVASFTPVSLRLRLTLMWTNNEFYCRPQIRRYLGGIRGPIRDRRFCPKTSRNTLAAKDRRWPINPSIMQ